MAKTSKNIEKRAPKAVKAINKVRWEFPLSKMNFIYLAIGLGVIIIGYALMSTGINNEPGAVEGTWNNPLAVQVAPVLLVIGYCVVIPVALMKLFKKQEDVQQ